MKFSDECYVKEKCKLAETCSYEDSHFCERLFKLDYLFNESLLSDTQRKHVGLHPDEDGTDRDKFVRLKEIENDIVGFVCRGENLYIHSTTTGNGKTAWAIRMIQAYLRAVWYKADLSCKALFINVPRFLLSLKDSISNQNEYIEHIKENILSADIVVWDEVGVKGLTQFEHENLLNYINTRIDFGKSNIFTSNLCGEELREKIGDRLYSRVVNYSIDVELNGKDKRGLCK